MQVERLMVAVIVVVIDARGAIAERREGARWWWRERRGEVVGVVVLVRPLAPSRPLLEWIIADCIFGIGVCVCVCLRENAAASVAWGKGAADAARRARSSHPLRRPRPSSTLLATR